jgi:hypothetical protein
MLINVKVVGSTPTRTTLFFGVIFTHTEVESISGHNASVRILFWTKTFASGRSLARHVGWTAGWTADFGIEKAQSIFSQPYLLTLMYYRRTVNSNLFVFDGRPIKSHCLLTMTSMYVPYISTIASSGIFNIE